MSKDADIKGMSMGALSTEVKKLRRELMDIRFDGAFRGTFPAGRIQAIRKRIARAKTEMGVRGS